jgi:hypothetical protein
VRLGAVSPTSPIAASLPAEGLDRVVVQRLFRFETGLRPADVLIHTQDGEPFLIRLQTGKGKVYVFAVSAQADCSNFPFLPPFLLVLHRAVNAHLVEAAEPLARTVFDELTLPLPGGAHRIVAPDGKATPLAQPTQGGLVFDGTELAGVYRLVAGDAAPETATPLAALNVPAAESELERLDPTAIHELVPNVAVSFVRPDGSQEPLIGEGGVQTAASTFPLAALAVAFLVGEVVLAWSMSRGRKTEEPA